MAIEILPGSRLHFVEKKTSRTDSNPSTFGQENFSCGSQWHT